MDRIENLRKNFKEFYEEATDAGKKGRFTAGFILFFKALAAAADFIIFKSKGIIPKNHKQRFNILPYVDPELMNLLSSAFEDYVNAYSMSISNEKFEELKKGGGEVWKKNWRDSGSF